MQYHCHVVTLFLGELFARIKVGWEYLVDDKFVRTFRYPALLLATFTQEIN